MRPNLSSPIAECFLPIACCLSLIAYCLLPLSASEPDRLAVYAPHVSYTLSVADLDGRQYVGIFELLEPLTTPDLKVVGAKWRLRVPDPKALNKTIDAEFEEGSATAKVRGQKIALSGPARRENQRLMLPLHGIGGVLIPLLGSDLVFHETSRRLFLGGTAEPVSTELRKGAPSTLALHFSAAVSPNINSDGNSLKLFFTRDPVISFGESEVLNDKLFSSSNYAEGNGTATITINGTSPLLAKFADDGKTILISAAPAPPPAPSAATASPSGGQQPQAQSATTTSVAEPPTEGNSPVAPRSPRSPGFLVVVDPGHGGTETGARIAPNLSEKDITLSLARALREQLQSRHIAVVLLRDSDIDLSLDQRAVLANLDRPAIFISLHAGPGTILRVYTPALPVATDTAPDRNAFLPWQSAQAAFTSDSTSLASAAAEAIGKRQIVVQSRPAFLQPLQSIAAPAIAVEAPADNHGLKIPEQQIAAALAEAVAARKSSLGGAQ